MDYRPIVTNFIRAVHPNLEKSKIPLWDKPEKSGVFCRTGFGGGRSAAVTDVRTAALL